MLIKDRHRLRLVLAVGSGLILFFFYMRLASPAATETLLELPPTWNDTSPSDPSSSQTTLDGSLVRPSGSGSSFIGSQGEIIGFAPPTTLRPGFFHPLHTEIFSVTTKDGQYFRITFGSEQTLNPNIIPHPHVQDTWIIIAQRRAEFTVGGNIVLQPSIELVCEARFVADDELTCVAADGTTPTEPRPLPIAPTAGDPAKCAGDLEYFSLNVGPHDARVFYGPEAPYVVYGSNSYFTCFGQWIVDLRSLGVAATTDWRPDALTTHHLADAPAVPPLAMASADFASPGGTELQRPPPYGFVEKNWFLFWDADGTPYVHFDIAPRRSFSQLDSSDGSAGPDLAPESAPADDACLARYLPRFVRPDLESVHQATNSLSVTLCRRADPACVPGDDNTFVLVVFHHKTFFSFHATYHPYVMLFGRRAPFALWAVGARPLWISGRNALLPGGDTEMMYVTSMSWRERGQTYHGYADDVLFLSFGVEDRMTGGIDVLAGDLLANLGLC